MDGTYPKVLERLLNEGSSGKRYEVFNMGVGGYHTSQEVETLRYKGLAFDPDYVLIGFCLNDLSTNASGGVYERLVAANEDTGWVEGVQARDRWFLKNSRAALLVAHYVGALSAESARSGDGRVEGPSNVSYGLRLLDELQSEHGFRALVVIVPAFDAPFDAYRYPRLHARMMQALPPGERIPVLDLLPRFQSAGHDAATLSRDGVHPNEAGHEAVARILLSELPEIFPEL
jgi:lysophospholipase L1-like esterase